MVPKKFEPLKFDCSTVLMPTDLVLWILSQLAFDLIGKNENWLLEDKKTTFFQVFFLMSCIFFSVQTAKQGK